LGVKERRKEKEKLKAEPEPESKEVEASDAPVESIAEAHKPEVEIISKESVEVSEIVEEPQVESPEITETEITETMPPWGGMKQSEWMYHIPPREEDKVLWAEEWGDFILQWTEFNRVHIISITTFIKEKPFSDILGKADALKIIGDTLTEKEIAQWLNKKKRQLRVYWRPLEDWADIIYQWALDTGNVRLDVKSIIIQEKEKSFATLPEDDLKIVVDLMVTKGYAEWIDRKKGAIKIIVI